MFLNYERIIIVISHLHKCHIWIYLMCVNSVFLFNFVCRIVMNRNENEIFFRNKSVILISTLRMIWKSMIILIFVRTTRLILSFWRDLICNEISNFWQKPIVTVRRLMLMFIFSNFIKFIFRNILVLKCTTIWNFFNVN